MRGCMQHLKTTPTSLPEWLAYCEQLHPKSIDMGLARVKTVADRMGLAFGCPIITVAGTNGKGSSCAMLEAILGEAGYRHRRDHLDYGIQDRTSR